MKTIRTLACLLAFAAASAQAAYVTHDGTDNLLVRADGQVLVLGTHCGDFYAEGMGEAVVYRNCGVNWSVTDSSASATLLGTTCADMRGQLAGAIALYQNCGSNWTVNRYGQLRLMGTGCADFRLITTGAYGEDIVYVNCGATWKVSQDGELLGRVR